MFEETETKTRYAKELRIDLVTGEKWFVMSDNTIKEKRNLGDLSDPTLSVYADQIIKDLETEGIVTDVIAAKAEFVKLCKDAVKPPEESVEEGETK